MRNFCVCGGKAAKLNSPDVSPKEVRKAESVASGDTPTVTSKKVYITRALPAAIIEPLANKFTVEMWESDCQQTPRDRLLQDVRGAAAILCNTCDEIDQQVLSAAGSQLQLICSLAADYDNIDVTACHRKNVILYCVADVCSDVIAEMTCALLLVTARRLMEGYQAVIDGEWGLWKPTWLLGTEIGGRVLGILGFSRVGKGVASRMMAFGISKIIFFDKDNPSNPSLHGDVQMEKVELEEVFSQSDFIVCTLPLTPETAGIVNAERLALCKPECIFINTASGGLVNHDDLLEALQTNQIAGAGLDVTDPEPLPVDHPLLALPNCRPEIIS